MEEKLMLVWRNDEEFGDKLPLNFKLWIDKHPSNHKSKIIYYLLYYQKVSQRMQNFPVLFEQIEEIKGFIMIFLWIKRINLVVKDITTNHP